jgi:spore coat polysaccharide biosynthesis protein SpsF (cytidylyltransferase family)
MKKKKIVALIQVRMDSTRLPGKALLDVAGCPLIERVINNLCRAQSLDEILIVTSNEPSDDPLASFAREKGVSIFRGDKINVIRRFYDAAVSVDADVVVRVTGDCPLVSAEIIDHLVERHINGDADYTSFDLTNTPEGTEAEIISFSALEQTVKNWPDLSYSEYMTYYFTNNPEVFLINIEPVPLRWEKPQYHLSIDTHEDLDMLCQIYQGMAVGPKECVPLNALLDFLEANPEVSEVNRDKSFKYKTDSDLIEKIMKATKLG